MSSIKQREMHRDSVCVSERDLCSLLWSMWHLSLHFNMSVQIWMLMSPNGLKKNAEHIYTYTVPFFFPSFCVLHTHIHAQTMLEQHEISRACWDFFVHRIHGRMLEKTFIKGFNTSRIFSWRIFFWTHTCRWHLCMLTALKLTFTHFYHLITCCLCIHQLLQTKSW